MLRVKRPGHKTQDRKRLLLQSLEDRTLFSAAPGVELFADLPHGGGATTEVAKPSSLPTEFVFVDMNIDGYESFVADLNTNGSRDFEVVKLRADADGIEQIAASLRGVRNVEAIHIFSHGKQGELQLGNGRLTLDSMQGKYADSLATVRAALTDRGDILIYGCNFGRGEIGEAAASALSNVTGADVAVSIDLTGSLSQGADWDLEHHLGVIETGIAASATFQTQSTVVLDPVSQEFYVPFTEQGIYDANEKILNEGAYGNVSTDTWTVVAATINNDNTLVVYDHHEDGYEADLDNPTQATTEVWGDNDVSNGIAPGYAVDVFNAGDLLQLQNMIDITNVPDVTYDFDGGDRFASDRGLAVIRAGWSNVPGTVLAGTVEVADTGRWGVEYTSPVGEDTVLNNVYEYVGLFVQALQNGTTVDIDTNADATVDTTVVLNQGETIHIDGGILQGATVSATAPVQVDLLTGDRDSGVDSRWYMLRPSDTWSSSYLSPAASTLASAPGSLAIFNPHTTDLNVDIETLSGTTTVTVGGGTTFVQPLAVETPSSGQLVTSTDGRDFYVVFAMDTDASHVTYDWGFSLLPTSSLTEMAFAGWAPGSLDLSGNGSPIWVTSEVATTLYVDYDGDPGTGALIDPFGNRYDAQIPIARLESAQIYDSSGDNDQSGLRVYTVDGTLIAAAWGIDPVTAGGGNPFLDMGTVVLPFPLPRIEKDVAVTTDINGNGVADPGDTVTWTISITNQDSNPLTTVLVLDDIPLRTTYVANSTTLDGIAYADDTVGTTLMPLDESGAMVPDVAANTTLVIEFETSLDDFPVVYDTVINTVLVQSDQGDRGASASLPINVEALVLEKEIQAINNASSGASGNIDVTYEFTIQNLDLIDIQTLTLTDDWTTQLGGNFVRIVPGSVTVTNIDATTAPIANAAYAGGAVESMISGGLLQSYQSFEVTLDVEVDPDADPSAHVLDNLVNQATVSGEDVLVPGIPITDLSDDPNDATNADSESDDEPDDPTAFTIAMIEVEKSAGAVTSAASGLDGNFDVEYTFSVSNTGIDDLTNLRLIDDWSTQFGSAFVRIVPGSLLINNIDATTTPNTNAAYAGGSAENMFDGTSGLVESRQSFEVTIVVEVDPDADPAALVNGLLSNQATVTGESSAGIVSDNSDDPTNPANIENDSNPDNDADDPTTIGIASIAATKVYSGSIAASSGTPGNVDATYTFEVTNTGSLDLNNLTLTDDWTGQLGGAFVRIVPGSVSVSNISATTSPGANAAYSGGAAENMLDGAGLLESSQRYLVSVDVELDPDSVTGIYQADGSLENQAIAGGDDPSSGTVTDPTDDTTDPTQNDINGDNNPDDPTRVSFTELVTVKTLQSGDSTPEEGDIVTFQIEITNNGAAQATSVSLSDLLPAGLTATANNGTVSQGTYDATTGLWLVGTLNNGASGTLILEGIVNVGQGGNTITNITTAATGDQNDPHTIGDDYIEIVTVNNDANLVTVKTLLSGDPRPEEGDIVTFQIDVTNGGMAQATNVSLTDLLPVGLTASVNNGTVSQGSYNATTGVWSIGTLNVSGSATLVLEGTVDVGQGGNAITNITSPAAGDQNDPDTIGDDYEQSVDPTLTRIELEKSVGLIVAASSGTNGNYDVTYSFTITNTGSADLVNLVLTDDWLSQFGANVVRVLPGSASVTNISATVAPGGNATYAGGSTDNILDGTGLLETGQSFNVSVIVELDPDADPTQLVNGTLSNQGIASGEDALEPGTPVSDPSDDPTIAANVDPDADGDPDDYTPVSFSAINLTKVLAGTPTVATSGTSGNIDVAFSFVVTNTGSTTLSNLSLLDDFAAEFGGAFVRVVPGTIALSNVDASTPPAINPAFNGTTGIDMLLGTATDRLESGQSFNVTLLVEVDPDSPTANLVGGVLQNQAMVSATDPSSNPVSDLSDNTADPTNVDPDSDNNPDDPTAVTFANIELEKRHAAVTPSASGAFGNYDVDYIFTVTNTGLTDLSNLSVVDDLATQFGGNFVRIIPGSLSVTNIDAITVPGVNTTYSGGATENILDGTGLLQTGQSFEVALSVEVDPDGDPLSLVNGRLVNQATASGVDPAAPGGPVSDTSDDPTNATDNDPDGDNDPDDPTALALSMIALEKHVAGISAATSGVPGNFDVAYRFVVTNTGSMDLDNLSLTDDWSAQFGANFITVLPGGVSVTNIDATTLPGANTLYSGGATDNMLDGTGVFESGQSFEVSVVVEVDADADPSFLVNGKLVNQAIAEGNNAAGGTVTDASDDPTDATNGDPNMDNNPDDPTTVSIASIVAEKTTGVAANASSGIAGNYDVTYNFTVTNNGSETLSNLTLIDDWATLFGTNYVAIVLNSVNVTNINATVAPNAIATYAGGASESMVSGGTLESGQSYEVSVVVEIDPDADPSLLVNGSLINQATASGDTPSSGTVSDLTDDPTDLTSNVDDPTPLLIPDIQLSKTVAGIVPVAGGNARADYRLVVTNTGTDTLTNLTLTDDWATQFGGAFISIVPGSVSILNISAAVAPGVNATYSGGGAENMLDGTGTIESGQSFEVRVQVIVDPDNPAANLINGALENSALVSGQGTSGVIVTDISDDPAEGADIELDGDNEPDDPTVLQFSDLGVAKQVIGVAKDGDNWNVELELIVQNTGGSDLTQISLVEDLATQFGAVFLNVAASPAITASTASMPPNLNTSWNGSSQTDIFDGTSGLLQAGEQITIRFTITIDPDVTGEAQPLSNQVQVGAIDPNGDPVTDTSDDGPDPNSTNPGAPGDTGTTDDPTPIEIGDIGLANEVVNLKHNFISQTVAVTIRLVMENTGTVDLNNLVLDDDVATHYGANFSAVTSAPVIISTAGGVTAPNLNPSWATSTAQNMFDGTSGLLPPGGQIVVEFEVELQPTESGVNISNQAFVTGSDPSGFLVSDPSDSGLSPHNNNGFGSTNDPTITQVTFFTYDSFNNSAPGFGGSTHDVGISSRPVLDTMYAGIAEPGTALRFQIYDQTGMQIGERTVVADAAGNWLVQFPNATLHARDGHYGSTHFGASFDGISNNGLTEFGARGHRIFHSRHGQSPPWRTFTASTLGHHLYHMPGTEIDGQPHRIEVQQTRAIQNSPPGGRGVRLYFHPAIHQQLYFHQNSTLSSVFDSQPKNVLRSFHAVNANPLQLGANPVNESNASSTNVSG